MPAGDVQIALPNGSAPTSKTVVGQTAIRPKAVNASFDGSGAAGPFLPCLVITGREGFEVARIPAPQVAAGASAEVSWFPRVGGQTASGGSGIQYDTDNEGDWLDVTTNGQDPSMSDVGMNFTANGFGIELNSLGLAGSISLLTQHGNVIELIAQSSGPINMFAGDVTAFVTGNFVVILNHSGTPTFTVKDHAFDPIFEVREDGSLHGKTGRSLVFDL